MATRRTDPSYRMQENEMNAQAMATSCTNPAYRRQEQIVNTNRKYNHHSLDALHKYIHLQSNSDEPFLTRMHPFQ
jgi:hypothetical protein